MSKSLKNKTKLNDMVSVKDFGAVGDGVTDDTDAIQAAIDHSFYSPSTIYIPSGTYCVTGLKVYGIYADNGIGTILSGSATHIKFSPNAILKMIASNGFVIQSAENPNTTIPTDEILYGIIENPIIDMDSKGDTGIFLQCAHHWEVISPDIRNVPSGTFSYNDGHISGAQTYYKSGITIKGIAGVAGAYYNKIRSGFIRGISTGTKGGCGINFVTTQGQTTQEPNFNEVSQVLTTACEYGINIERGFNQNINMCDASGCTTGIRVNTGRNVIFKPYLESSTTGIEFTSNSGFNALNNLCSVGSTTTPILDNGVDNTMYPENYFPRYSAMSTGGSGYTSQNVLTNTWTKVQIDSSILSSGSSMSDVTNSRIKIDSDGTSEGLYLIIGSMRFSDAVVGKIYELAVYKNGSVIYPYARVIAPTIDAFHMQVITYTYLEKDDYVELWLRQQTGTTITLLDGAHNQLCAIKQMTPINKAIYHR